MARLAPCLVLAGGCSGARCPQEGMEEVMMFIITHIIR